VFVAGEGYEISFGRPLQAPSRELYYLDVFAELGRKIWYDIPNVMAVVDLTLNLLILAVVATLPELDVT